MFPSLKLKHLLNNDIRRNMFRKSSFAALTAGYKCQKGLEPDPDQFIYSRPFLPSGDDEPVPQRGVHGEDWTAVSFCHNSNQKVFPPDVHVSVDRSGKRQVVLNKTNTDLLQPKTCSFMNV